MKKIILVFFMAVILVLSSSFLYGCNKSKKTKPSYSARAVKKSDNKIKYTILYRGFITIRQGTDPMPPDNIFVFRNNNDWQNFCNKYMPGVYSITSMLSSLDFDNYYVVYIFAINAKPAYGCSILVDSLQIIDNQLQPSYATTASDLSNLYYAENRDNIVHPFVNILRVSKDDIPDTLINLYTQNK